MIKARVGLRGGGEALLLGITAENVRRLKEGQPIWVDGESLDLPVALSIAYGETEQALAEEMRRAGFPIPEYTDPKPGEEKMWVAQGAPSAGEVAEDVDERLEAMFSSYYASMRYAAPEMFDTHLKMLRERVEGLIEDVRS